MSEAPSQTKAAVETAPKVAAVIVAAGRGTRAVASDRPDLPKQYQKIGGEVMLKRTVEQFRSHPAITHIAVVISPEDQSLYDAAIYPCDRLLAPAFGGATRQASVFAGLEAVAAAGPDYVLIHDGARPFLPHSAIDSALDALKTVPAIVSGLPVFDTVKRVKAEGVIAETVDRSPLRTVQTPQGFQFPIIYEAHKAAVKAGRMEFTDDAAVAEWAGVPVRVVPGSADNIKLTTPADFDRAEEKLAKETKAAPQFETRVGTGFDVHALVDGDGVILGGVTIPFDKRLKGHSDADVALHTITDAIYGALADGDIGHHFPPSDDQWKGKESAHFLRHAVERVSACGGLIVNVDLTIICERPKVGPHRDEIRKNVAALMALDLARVSVKATTTEKLGFTGRQEGIAAQAVVSISLPPNDDTVLPEERPFSAELVRAAEELIAHCTGNGVKIATAESCTGGLIAGLLTSVAGSSAVVDRGFVTYSNDAKTEMLGVPAAMIAEHGAVSESVARAMAEGALARSNATIAVAVTGVAGPGGGSAEKPVGLVHFGAAHKDGDVIHQRIIFPDNGRTGIRRATVVEALEMILGRLN